MSEEEIQTKCKCAKYAMSWPTGKGPCTVCKRYYMPVYLMTTSPRNTICEECHSNDALHRVLVSEEIK